MDSERDRLFWLAIWRAATAILDAIEIRMICAGYLSIRTAEIRKQFKAEQ